MGLRGVNDSQKHPEVQPEAPALGRVGGRAGTSRSAWRSIAGAQESGLVAVIALMVIALWFAAPVKQRTETVALGPADTQVEEGNAFIVTWADGRTQRFAKGEGWVLEPTVRNYPAGTIVEPDEGGFRITRPGREASILEGDWRRENLDGGGIRMHQERLIQNRRYNTFLNSDNVVSVLESSSYYAIMAVGMAGIIVMGGIDLSIGAIYCLAAVVGSLILRKMGSDAPWITAVPTALVVCCGVGAICGAINGLGTVLLRVHPFIITLGMMSVFRGVAFLLTEGASITGIPASVTSGFIRVPIFGFQIMPILLTLLVAIIGTVLFARTVFGRRTFAIGGNETAAKYAGVPVGRVKVLLFAFAGALAGLAAVIYLGRFGAADSGAGRGDELAVIAAAVVGGCSLSGGRGSALGAVLGAVIIALIRNATTILNVPSSWTEVVLGLTIIVAVVVDQAKHRLGRGKR